MSVATAGQATCLPMSLTGSPGIFLPSFADCNNRCLSSSQAYVGLVNVGGRVNCLCQNGQLSAGESGMPASTCAPCPGSLFGGKFIEYHYRFQFNISY
jgi:hypothetical protein